MPELVEKFDVHANRITDWKKRKEMADRKHPLPVTRQCALLDLPRSTFHHVPKPVPDQELELMALSTGTDEEGRQGHEGTSVGHPECYCAEGQQRARRGYQQPLEAIKVRRHGIRNKERFANAIYFYLGGLDL